MTAAETHAELMKLGRLLGVPPARLSGLEAAAPADLRALRGQVGERLFAADREAFARVGLLARTIPAAISAKVAEKVLSPMLAARATESLSPEKAGELAGRLPASFLADVAQHLDPMRTADVVVGVPAAKIVEVAAELARREDWVTMGEFVGHLPAATLRATMSALDGAAMLQVWFVLDAKDRLDEIAAMLTDEQAAALVAAADGLDEQFADLLAHLSPEQRARLS
ncbi:hypothetical protein [Labedaea rhizosphaerae]|uniref:Uncharacterized protein n=1 Tax=Labedaea rhizosphaerae TaxID=598644 RepID=A0A4R6SDA2_LABRH|nr:hypothetical protein [Labedaea rhizosphaerae]TDP97911.1 hypothetical protein EV186_103890 [Labedaea rhizosphaerae]